MLDAITRARETLPKFVDLVCQHVDNAYIKFPFETDQKAIEHVWAYVHHYQDGVFNVSMVSTPYTQKQRYEIRRDVHEADVEDWQIMMPDGQVKGGYSLIGAFRYLERKGIRLNRTMRKQKAQLIDAAAYEVSE